ncbi:uncharacterized protein K460DRAFT_350180 [Cucurbitaria berberidis CBS 394.84]|uniref:Uncharacterized protein n=1 Tax=Cucurbitaria berberidis CBS 394.84 TaxID=1168544 RepID=A0A9P4GRQ9_9PLEO|nr:uncharacterized protein K460DRAFT_350180 [Cucurbitaria berberidis CBS 394.84]KAF1850074.1 hypothetical protein K460DRAFT_350180 [Cucurbitaria berberidis CBS 394.84]
MFSSTNTTTAATAAALTKVAAMPIDIVRTTRKLIASVNPFTLSFAQAAHVKLKADSMAMVLFCIAKQLCAYVEGWRKGWRKRKRDRNVMETEKKHKEIKMKKLKGRKKGGHTRIVAKGRYTLILQ